VVYDEDDQFRSRQTEPNIRTSLEYRHGLLLRDVAAQWQRISDLESRVDHLDGVSRSLAPRHSQKMQFTWSTIIAGITAGIISALGQFLN